MQSLPGCRPPGVFCCRPGGIGTPDANWPTKPQHSSGGGGVQPHGLRSRIDDRLPPLNVPSGSCGSPDLRGDLQTGFVAIYYVDRPLPAGRADRLAACMPLRPAGRHRRLAGRDRSVWPRSFSGRSTRPVQTCSANMRPGIAPAFGVSAPLQDEAADSPEEWRGATRLSHIRSSVPGCSDQTRTRMARRAAQRKRPLRRSSRISR